MKKELFIIGILCWSLTACYDQFDESTSTSIPDAPEIYVDAHLIGDVKLINETQIDQYVVDVNDNSEMVENGFINMNLDFVNELSQVIEINTPGGESALAVMPIHRNATTYASLYLFPDFETQSIPNNSDYNLELPGLGQLSGNSNALSSSSPISAHIRTLNEEKLVNQLGHRGSGPGKEVWAVDIRTAFQFNFTDPQSNSVGLKENESIELDLNQINTQGDHVLLHLDQSLGIWEFAEYLDNGTQVSLTKTGMYAIANVQPAAIVRSILKIGDKPISFHTFTLGSGDIKVEVRSVSSGEWLALVPINQEIEMTFISPCGDDLGTNSFDAISEDIFLPPFELQGSQNYFNITASVIDCEGNDSDEPAFILSNGSVQQTYAFMNTPDVYVPLCNEELTINATDLETGELGPSIDWNANNELSLDILSKCMTFQEGYAYVNVDGEEKVLDDLLITVDPGLTTFIAADGTFRLKVAGTQVASYNEQDVNIFINDDSFGPQGYFIDCNNSDLGCGITKCEMTHFAEEDGEWYRVQFEGEIWVRTIDPPVAGYKPIQGVILTKK